MNDSKLTHLTDGVKEAAKALRGVMSAQEFTKVSAFDYGIPQDRAAERILIDAVRDMNLDCKIIAEESGISGKHDAEYTVYIDPLDGSVNFSRGIPSFCIGVAVYKGDVPLVGIVLDPNTDELFVARRGKGISLNGNPFTPAVHEGNLLINMEWFGASNFLTIAERLKESGLRARLAGSGVLALMYGCIGRGDGTILLQNKPWDVAPGLVFAQELGCIVTSLNGTPVNLSRPSIDIIAAKDDATHALLLNACSG